MGSWNVHKSISGSRSSPAPNASFGPMSPVPESLVSTLRRILHRSTHHMYNTIPFSRVTLLQPAWTSLRVIIRLTDRSLDWKVWEEVLSSFSSGTCCHPNHQLHLCRWLMKEHNQSNLVDYRLFVTAVRYDQSHASVIGFDGEEKLWKWRTFYTVEASLLSANFKIIDSLFLRLFLLNIGERFSNLNPKWNLCMSSRWFWFKIHRSKILQPVSYCSQISRNWTSYNTDRLKKL